MMYLFSPLYLVNSGFWIVFISRVGYDHSDHNTQSLHRFENSVIAALKSDICTFYTCQINKGDIWLQFEKLKKNRQIALS